MQVQPHLCFEGRCEEAVEFYRRALGAEVTTLVRFKDMPGPHPPGTIPPGGEDKVMHASLRVGESTVLASDGRCAGRAGFQGIQLALQVRDIATAERLFKALADGGHVQMPLAKTFWSPGFGMLADRFGLTWMVNVSSQNGPA
jgi:PhnB protein